MSHNESAFDQATSDSYYLELGPGAKNPVISPGGRCWGVADTAELITAVNTLRSPVFLFYQDKPPGEASNDPEFGDSGIVGASRMEILVGKAKITYDGKTAGGAVYLRGHNAACRHIRQATYSFNLVTISVPITEWDKFNNCIPIAPQFQAIPTPKEKAYVVSIQNVVQFLEDSTITIPEKIVSGYLMAFPQVVKWVLSECDVHPYNPPAGVGAAQTPPTPVQQMCALGIMVLTPAYSRDQRLAQQLFRRINAAASGGGFPAVSQADVQSLVDSASWVASSSSRLGPELAGRTCALTNTYVYDPDVFVEDLAGVDEVSQHFHLEKWSKQLLVQARLVFHNYQAVSLHFGFSIAEIGADVLTSLGGKWKAELDLMDSLSEKMVKSMFLGCRGQVPESHQVKMMPRLIYIGAYYYQINLTSEEEKAEFAYFNIDGIMKHITPSKDINMCQAIAESLPSGSVIALGTLLGNCSIGTAESVMTNKSELEKKAVYFFLKDKYPDSPWYVDQKEREEAEWRMKIRRELSGEIEKIYENTLKKMSSIAAREQDANRRLALLAQIDSYTAGYAARVGDLVSIDDITPAVPRADLEEVRTALMDEYEDLFYYALQVDKPEPSRREAPSPDPQEGPNPPDTAQGV